MNKDYYQILEVKRDCSQEDIAKAYRKLSLKYHPDLCELDGTTGYHYFCLVSEAYEVLSDLSRRQFYDMHGEQTLKEGLIVGGEVKGGYQFNGHPEHIFQKFFGNNNAFTQLYDQQGDAPSMMGQAFGMLAQPSQQPIANKCVEVPCTLNELYNGCSKKVKYSRQVLCQDGRTSQEVKEHRNIDIQPGCPNGFCITFHQLGNESAGQVASDLVFILKEEEHTDYKREGNQLTYMKHITLLQALTAQSVNIVTLDGRELLISLDSVISPETTKLVSNEGMPIQGTNRKGDLLLKFNISFPKAIHPDHKQQLKELLS